MFVVLLKFSKNKSQAGQYMDGHNAWIQRGMRDGVFIMVGSLQPSMGGGILAHNISQSELQDRVNEDPFVAEGVVSAEILEITPALTSSQMEFLLA